MGVYCKYPVVVAGLFRNGTSLLTYLLTDTLNYAVPPDYKRANGESNVEVNAANYLFGHFKAHPAIHWQLQRMFDYPTWDINRVDEMVSHTRNKEPSQRVQEAVTKIIVNANRQGRQWYIKGTRLPIQLPFWYPHFPDETRYIVPYRHPVLSALSMLKHGETFPFFAVIRSISEAVDVYNLYYDYLLCWLDLHPELHVIGVNYNEWYEHTPLADKLTKHISCTVTPHAISRVFFPTRTRRDIDQILQHTTVDADMSVYRRLQKRFP